MARYQFALSNSDAEMSQAGVVQSDSFAEALELLGEQMEVTDGDLLEIGVAGFPPARFQCTLSLLDGVVHWHPQSMRLAA